MCFIDYFLILHGSPERIWYITTTTTKNRRLEEPLNEHNRSQIRLLTFPKFNTWRHLLGHRDTDSSHKYSGIRVANLAASAGGRCRKNERPVISSTSPTVALCVIK